MAEEISGGALGLWKSSSAKGREQLFFNSAKTTNLSVKKINEVVHGKSVREIDYSSSDSICSPPPREISSAMKSSFDVESISLV